MILMIISSPSPTVERTRGELVPVIMAAKIVRGENVVQLGIRNNKGR